MWRLDKLAAAFCGLLVVLIALGDADRIDDEIEALREKYLAPREKYLAPPPSGRMPNIAVFHASVTSVDVTPDDLKKSFKNATATFREQVN